MFNITLAAITKNGIKKDEKWHDLAKNGDRSHLLKKGACPHLLPFIEKMPNFYRISASKTKNWPKREKNWQVFCLNNIIFLTEFANYVVLKSNSFLYLSYITYRRLCSII